MNRIKAAAALAAVLCVLAAGGAFAADTSPITLTLMVQDGEQTWNQLHDSAVQQEMKRATGVTLEVTYVTEDKYNVVVASGDLPDLLRVNIQRNLRTLVEGGNIISLDDLAAAYGKDILANIPRTIATRKQYNSLGTGKLYTIPVQIGLDADGQEASIGPTVRWDVYKEIGAPVLKTEDDLLAALAKMVKAHPVTETGKTVYGVGFWSDWGTWCYTIPFMSIDGYYNVGSAYIRNDTGAVCNEYTDMKSPFWRSVAFYYKANKLGILDKDSFIQKFADFTAKCTAGQEMNSYANWATGDFNRDNAATGKGFVVLPMESGAQWKGSTMPMGWPDKDWAITKSARNPARAMAFIDYYYSFDGMRTLYSGVKGTHWDVVNGKPQLLDSTIALRQKGGTEWQSQCIINDVNAIGMSPFTVNPADKMPVSLWETEKVYATGLSALQKSFSEHYGVKYPNAIFAKKLAEKKNFNQSGQDQLANGLMAAPTDEITRLGTSLDAIAVKGAAKCVLAKTDAEFETARKQLVSDLKAAGAEKHYQWYLAEWNKARELAKKVAK